MKSPFEYPNYREFLKELMYGSDSKRGVQSKIAQAIGCQASYLLQVLKGKAELTEDHTIKLAQYLMLRDSETDYLLLMLRISRAATPELSRFLEKKRQALLNDEKELSTKVKSKPLLDSDPFLSHYFSSWIPSTIHIATSSKKFQSASDISERLGLSLELVEEQLKFLEKYELVRRDGKNFQFSGGSIHLPRNSSLNEAHQTGRRLQALRSIQQPQKQDLHFSSVFTLDKASYLEIKEIISQMISEAHDKIHAAGTDEIYSMCIDLFEVR